jgi:hypothetical protein
MEIRWPEKDRSGRRIYRKRVIGTVQQYPDDQAVREVMAVLVGHINAGTGERTITVEQICEHFEQRELRSGDSLRSFATAQTYRGYIRKWIKPGWGSATRTKSRLWTSKHGCGVFPSLDHRAQ